MKQMLSVLTAVVTALVLWGCDLEIAPGGDLYAHWHLEAVDTLGGQTKNLSGEKIFWGVENRLVHCADENKVYPPIVMRFERTGDSLFLQPPVFDDRANGDPEVTEVRDVEPFGLPSLGSRWRIETLNANRMTLSGKSLRLHFRKL